MKETISPREWCCKHVDVGYMMLNIVKNLREAIMFNHLSESGYYEAHIADIVSGSYGKYVSIYALKYFDYDIDENDIDKFSTDEILYELDYFSYTVSSYIESKIRNRYNIDIFIKFDYWHDGAYSLITSIHHADKNRLENLLIGSDVIE